MAALGLRVCGAVPRCTRPLQHADSEGRPGRSSPSPGPPVLRWVRPTPALLGARVVTGKWLMGKWTASPHDLWVQGKE